MIILTRAQRAALKRIFDRAPIFVAKNRFTQTTLTYRGFRRRVAPTFGCDRAVIVDWKGMWLCIETDGYIHS